MLIDTRRRALLVGTASAALLTLIPANSEAATRLDAAGFLQLSQDLAGRQDLDPDLAAAYLAAFESLGKGEDLVRLSTMAPAERDSQHLAEEIVAAWYTGTVALDSGQKLVTYEDALLWDSLDYTKPPGICSSEGFGSWAKEWKP